jgi:hypothetical protein
MMLFHDIAAHKFHFKICLNSCLKCLDIIEFLTRNFNTNDFLIQNGEIVFEILTHIEIKLKEEDWAKYELYENELTGLFSFLKMNNWI